MAIEKTQAIAALWKAELQHAWKDVPLQVADEKGFVTWLPKWNSSAEVEVSHRNRVTGTLVTRFRRTLYISEWGVTRFRPWSAL